ncbi:hypothetical protein HPB48_018232 [Haemaphysalis longicornis]|uniref:Nose resistant-to-fluoxetine protein N-terminal domain-containing protein n=1 Tax=Haemaphysalis longicornis TaxID=44386 RepID=A0A9J6FEG0_HAELO|nr:hypothetical protein HPB48_018232 [Haemaphysalis longicornis]
MLISLSLFLCFSPVSTQVLDATGKYPTGLIEGTVVDLGSYDECVATVLRDKYGVTKTRGQYCVLELRVPSDDLMTEHFVPAAAITHKRVRFFLVVRTKFGF